MKKIVPCKSPQFGLMYEERQNWLWGGMRPSCGVQAALLPPLNVSLAVIRFLQMEHTPKEILRMNLWLLKICVAEYWVSMKKTKKGCM